MTRKPWPILILAGLFFFEPLFKIAFYSILWKLSVSKVVMAPSLRTPYWFFMYFLACPIAGISIFAVKRWSIGVFLFIEALTVATHFYNWHLTPKYFPLPVVLGMCLLNVTVVLYFLIPAVHLAYIHPKFRWWESKPRYVVDWKVAILQAQSSLSGVIRNISERGMFFECSKELKDGPLTLSFSHLGYDFSLPGSIRHDFEENGKYHYGVEFEQLNGENKRQLARSIKSLEKSDCVRRPPRINNFRSLVEWAHRLITTGEGLVPSLNDPYSHARSNKDKMKKAS